MQQTKAKRYYPGPRFGKTGSPLAPMNDLASHKDDAQSNRCLDWLAWNVHESQRRGRECDAMRDCKRGDGSDELAPSLHQNEQSEHEQQMVDAEKNVLYT